MTTQTQVSTDWKNARRPRFDRAVAMELAATECEWLADLLDLLTPEQWGADTDCPDWDVRAMAGHMLGMVEMASSVPEINRPRPLPEVEGRAAFIGDRAGTRSWTGSATEGLPLVHPDVAHRAFSRSPPPTGDQ